MSSSSQTNRNNSLKSTGPKTAEGKRKSSQNAIKHGLFAKDILITGEDTEEFRLHKSAMLRRLNPRDVLELHLVEQIIADAWTIKRVRAAEQELYVDAKHAMVKQEVDWRAQLSSLESKWLSRKKTPAGYLSKLFDSEKLERLHGYQRRLSSSFHRCLKELRDLRKEKDDPNEPLTDLAHSILCELVSDDEDVMAQNEAISNATAGPIVTCDATSVAQTDRLDDKTTLEKDNEQKIEHENDPPVVPKAA